MVIKHYYAYTVVFLDIIKQYTNRINKLKDQIEAGASYLDRLRGARCQIFPENLTKCARQCLHSLRIPFLLKADPYDEDTHQYEFIL